MALVRLEHVGKFNAMSRSMWRDLKSLFEALSTRPRLRCVVITGVGGHFCAGGDISEYPAFRFDPVALAHFHENEVWGGLAAMVACPVPVVAAIEGNCMGAGVEMASCCDIRVASHCARFGAPIARLGFPMAPREAQLVVQAVGLRAAKEMLLEAAVFSASDMHSGGFLNRLTVKGEVMTEALNTAQRIVSLSPEAARLNKQTLRALGQGPEKMAALVAGAYAYANHPDHHEGISAFLGKRNPVFE